MNHMDYMFAKGFLGTNAPFFMDVVTLIVAILPLLVYGSILLVRKKMIKLHMLTQNIIFFISIVIIGYFELGVRVGGGFSAFMSESDVSYTYALVVLIVHIVIATLTLLYWTLTIMRGNYHYFKNELPGKYTTLHKIIALKSTLGIIFTSFSAIWVYLLLFVY